MQIEGQSVLTVSEITSAIKETVESHFRDVCIQGEISQFTRASSGHIYMTLKDEGAVLKTILWRSTARGLRFDIEEGMEVVCRGGIDIYPPRGSYQLIVREMHPCGAGSLQLAFKQLVNKLEKEGLFEQKHKKTLPPYPEKIGIVTSETGAALRDMIRVIKRRWPVATLYLLPAPVQGGKAAGKISNAIRLLNLKRTDLDLIIVGRGGGSLEDLWAFNEECVARAIFDSKIPIVSAVGHEVDISISDLVADHRAATPSEAGENSVPDQFALIAATVRLAGRLGQALRNRVRHSRERLEALGQRHVMSHPESLLHNKIQQTDELAARMKAAMGRQVDFCRKNIDSLNARLESLNPQKVLQRGYSITFGPDGKNIQNASCVQAGDVIRTILKKGNINSTVASNSP